MVELIKSLYNLIMMPVRLVLGIASDLLKLLYKFLLKAASYTYDACDICVRHIIYAFRNQHVKIKLWFGRENKGRYFKALSVTAVIVLTIILFIYAFSFYFFIVPPGDSAVITRFGRFNRVLNSGLGFRFPLVERYYIVQNETIREERFGFRQGPNKSSDLPYVQDEQQKYVRDVFEPKISRSEKDTEGFFSEKGDIVDELSREQRVSHDYVRRNYAPKVQKTPTLIKQQIATKENLKRAHDKAGAKLAGQYPYHSERQMLTGDMSIVYIEWTLQYYINDVETYLFNSRDVQRNIRDISLAIMNEVIGEYRIDGIITYERHKIEKEVEARIQKILDEYNIGIKVTQVIILNALPPKEVEAAFNEVNRAAQDMEKLKYNAEIEYLKLIPKARGQAKRIIAEAEGYAIEVTNKAKGEAGQFLKINKQYLKAKQITEDRLYIEAMEKVIKETPNIIMDNQVKGLLPVFMGGDSSSKLKDVLKGKSQRSLMGGKPSITSKQAAEIAKHLKPAPTLNGQASSAAKPITPNNEPSSQAATTTGGTP